MTMAVLSDRTALFERVRPRLFGIAYRMLGSVEDGEDLVQEAFLRWQQSDVATLREPEGWLVTVATRLAIDKLRRARRERETYIGPWLPEPIATAGWARSDERAELDSDLSMAFLVMLERLAPEERAALLLHDVFDSDYREIARTLEKSEAACRQIVHRARQRVRQDQPRFAVDREVTGQLFERLLAALQADDKDAVLSLVAEDVTWTSDGGGKVTAARKVMRGALSVARFMLGVERKARGLVSHKIAWLNGEPTWVRYVDGRLFCTTSIVTDGSRILGFYAVLNPDKLRHVL
jgi:RNA polymerase sigma-70 factor (ECF subfamily)